MKHQPYFLKQKDIGQNNHNNGIMMKIFNKICNLRKKKDEFFIFSLIRFTLSLIIKVKIL